MAAQSHSKGERTRLRLVEQARRLFSDQGYDHTTIEQITQAARVTKGTFYFHFDTKEEALLAVLQAWADKRLPRLRAASQRRAPDDAVVLTVERLLSPEMAGRRDGRLLLELWSQADRNARVRKALGRVYRAWRDAILAALDRAKQAGVLDGALDTEAAADVLLALHDGLLARNVLGFTARASWRSGVAAARQLVFATSQARAGRIPAAG